MNYAEICIIKRDGKREDFSISKIKNAISKAFSATGIQDEQQLIADIIEYQQPDTTVRLVGRTNNPDGGRDIIIRRKEGENRKLTICQCKAYQNSANKSHVTDIRDTLDYYEATGFLLAVTSDITAPLIDHLTSLEKKYDVDWWTRRELFKIMRQYPSLVNAYQDIIKVVDNKEGQS